MEQQRDGDRTHGEEVVFKEMTEENFRDLTHD